MASIKLPALANESGVTKFQIDKFMDWLLTVGLIKQVVRTDVKQEEQGSTITFLFATFCSIAAALLRAKKMPQRGKNVYAFM